MSAIPKPYTAPHIPRNILIPFFSLLDTRLTAHKLRIGPGRHAGRQRLFQLFTPRLDAVSTRPGMQLRDVSAALNPSGKNDACIFWQESRIESIDQ
jgi:hypothetical protein